MPISVPDIENAVYDSVLTAKKVSVVGSIANTATITEEEITEISTTVSDSENTTIVTPTAGKKVRLAYVAYCNGGSADITVYTRFAVAGTAKYKILLKPGAMYARNIAAGKKKVTGAVNEALITNLSAAGTVLTIYEYAED